MDKKIYRGRVTSVHNDIVVVSNKEMKKVVVLKGELELNPTGGSALKFLNRDVKFVLLGKDEDKGVYLGSIKEATKLLLPKTMKLLQDGKKANATIVGLISYGAFVEVNGIVGMLKNKDFTVEGDYTAVSDVLRVGSKVEVKLKKTEQTENMGETPKLQFEAIKKYKHPAPAKATDYTPGQVVAGKLKQIKTDRCYVNIGPNLDAMCPHPGFDLEVGMSVAFHINQVREEVAENGKKRIKVRGKIKRAY